MATRGAGPLLFPDREGTAGRHRAHRRRNFEHSLKPDSEGVEFQGVNCSSCGAALASTGPCPTCGSLPPPETVGHPGPAAAGVTAPGGWGSWPPPPAHAWPTPLFPSQPPAGWWLPPPPPPRGRPGTTRVLVLATIAGALAVVLLGMLAIQVVGPDLATIARARGPARSAYIPKLDARGDPAWVPIPLNVPKASTAGLPGAMTALSDPGPVVTPAMARSVLSATWELRHEASVQGSASLFAAFETGPALEEDLGRCNCGEPDPFGAMEESSVLVARQAAWPAEFLAQVGTTIGGDPWVQTLVFRRTDASEPWKVVLATGYKPVATPVLEQPAAGPDGFDAPPPASVAAPVGLTALPGALAAYWQGWKDHGADPATQVFNAGPWTTQEGRTLATYGQGKTNDNGLIGRYVFAADVAKDGLYVFAAQGHTLACGVLREEKTWTGPGGGVVFQDRARSNWGPTVAPGIYRAVIGSNIFEPCFRVRQGWLVDVSSAGQLDDALLPIR